MIEPSISIIIPNWNGAKLLKDCLTSLSKIRYKNYQIIVVDNASSDNSVEMMKKNFPNAHILLNKENLGFAKACNIGIKFSLSRGADFVLLLNNDTVVDRDFLNKMADTAQKDKNIGIVGAKIYYFDEPNKIWFGGGKFIKWRVSGKHMYWQKLDSSKLTGDIDSDFITGCAMLIKKDVFNKIGLFYEPYFLTVEDLDFCYYAKKAGYKIKTSLDAKIWHKVSSSRLGEFSFSNGYYGTRNRLFFAFKRMKNYYGTFVFLFIIIPIRIIQWFFQGRRQMLKGLIFGTVDFFKNNLENHETKHHHTGLQ